MAQATVTQEDFKVLERALQEFIDSQPAQQQEMLRLMIEATRAEPIEGDGSGYVLRFTYPQLGEQRVMVKFPDGDDTAGYSRVRCC